MATADSATAKMRALIAKANETTGNTDADLTSAVNSLVSGYGAGDSADYEYYDGDYVVTPTSGEQTLQTEQKVLTANVKVSAIPYASVSNASGGETITIG